MEEFGIADRHALILSDARYGRVRLLGSWHDLVLSGDSGGLCLAANFPFWPEYQVKVSQMTSTPQ